MSKLKTDKKAKPGANMMSRSPNRYHLIVTAADKTKAQALLKKATGKDADLSSLIVPLNTSGSGTPTHWGGSGQFTDAHMAVFATEKAAGRFPSGLKSYPTGWDNRVVKDTNHTADRTKIGQEMTFDQAIAAAGLKRIAGAV